MSNNEGGWIVAGSVAGAFIGGIPGAIAGAVIGSIIQAVIKCPRCGETMSNHPTTNTLVCRKCGYHK